MAIDSKKSIVPHEIIMNGDASQPYFSLKKPDGTVVFTVYGDGKIGFFGKAPTGQASALTAPVVAAASMTFTDPGGSSDYAFATATTSTPAGYSSVAEANSLLKVVQNALLRIEQINTALQNAGIVG